MRQPRLPRRLRAALELVPADVRRVADIGAGHGALSVHLAWTSRSVIATEAQRGPFDELRRNLSGWDAAALVDARHGSDLAPLQTGEVDAVVVAGMGARTVMRICATAAEKNAGRSSANDGDESHRGRRVDCGSAKRRHAAERSCGIRCSIRP